MATTVAGATATQSQTTESTKKKADALGKDEFLKLLLTQLSNQDPLSPMNDTEFISQMAQFTSLEQMTNLNTSMNATRAASLIGGRVSWAESGKEVSGVVTGVRIIDGEPNLIIENQIAIGLDEVISVTPVPASTTPTTPTTPTTTTG